MRPIDSEAKIKLIVAELDSRAVLERMREYEKAGYPGSSMSDGRGSAETPCPVAVTVESEDWRPTPRDPETTAWNRPSLDVVGVADPLDRQIRTDRLQLEQSLRFMLTAAETIIGISRKYTNARSNDADKESKLAPPPGAGPCGNAFCDHLCSGIGNDRLRKAPKRTGDDPAKATIARCQNCDQYWRRNGVERDPRERVAVKR